VLKGKEALKPIHGMFGWLERAHERICSGHPHWASKIGHWRIDETARKPFPCLTVANFQCPMRNLFPDETRLSSYKSYSIALCVKIDQAAVTFSDPTELYEVGGPEPHFKRLRIFMQGGADAVLPRWI
jgi:hypothetical protein